jgi:hypothetical protein
LITNGNAIVLRNAPTDPTMFIDAERAPVFGPPRSEQVVQLGLTARSRPSTATENNATKASALVT